MEAEGKPKLCSQGPHPNILHHPVLNVSRPPGTLLGLRLAAWAGIFVGGFLILRAIGSHQLPALGFALSVGGFLLIRHLNHYKVRASRENWEASNPAPVLKFNCQ